MEDAENKAEGRRDSIHRDIGCKAEGEVGELRRFFWVFLSSILVMDSLAKA